MTDILITQSAVTATVVSDAVVGVVPVAQPVIALIGSGSGVSDHGDLAGLADDDHPHYLTATRADTRYSALAHIHAIADTPGLQATLDAKLDGDSGAFRVRATSADAIVEASTDGTSWIEAFRLARDSGVATFKNAIRWLGDTIDDVPLVNPDTVAVYVPASADATAPKFSISFSNHPVTGGGPTGEPNYWNHVAHLGWNWSGGTRETTSQAGFGLSFESKFYDGARFGHEFHLQGEDSNGNPHRWLTFFLPRDGGAGSGAGISADYFFLRTQDAQQRIRFSLAGASPGIELQGGTRIISADNNIPLLMQKNAAGTAFVPLLFLDSFNRTVTGGPVYINAAPEGEYGALLPINATGLTGNKSILYAQGNAVTGTLYALHLANLAATGSVVAMVGNATVNGHCVHELQTRPGTGDPLVAFTAADAAMCWSAGIDQSASAFKISAGYRRLGGSGGAEDRLVIDDAKVEVKRGLKLPSYTVAGLPSASTAGAGTLVYVTNAIGGPTLACSDGTSWRTIAVLGAVVV